MTDTGLRGAGLSSGFGVTNQAMSDPGSLSRAGIGAYALSFFLASVAGTGTRGYGCAIAALLGPFIAFESPSGSAEFFDGNPLGFVALFVSGLVNVVFPLAMFLKFKRYSRGFAIARIAVLAMIPCSWVVFVMTPVFPREGHVFWVAGMSLALFSDELAARRRGDREAGS